MSRQDFNDRSRKILQNKAIEGGVADNTRRIVLPQNTTDGLAELERHQGAIAYDTTLDKVVVDDGETGFSPVSSGSSSGANDTLSNLTAPTAINTDLTFDNNNRVIQIPEHTSGAGNGRSLTVKSGDVSLSGRNGGNLTLTGGNSPNGNRGGTVTITGGLGNSQRGGNIDITGGASTSALGGAVTIASGSGGSGRGAIKLQNGTEGTSGHVWKQDQTDGSGAWSTVSSQQNVTIQFNSVNTNIKLRKVDDMVTLMVTSPINDIAVVGPAQIAAPAASIPADFAPGDPYAFPFIITDGTTYFTAYLTVLTDGSVVMYDENYQDFASGSYVWDPFSVSWSTDAF